MAHFVFIEFTEPRLNLFLTQLREALQNEASSKPVHITVRGPYRAPPDPEFFRTLSQNLRGHGVCLRGAGTFETETGYVVFLRAEASVLKALWWKPDFPDSSHGVNPHVTLFETSSKAAAKEVEGFLRAEKIRIHTHGVELSLYQSKQSELFGTAMATRVPRARLTHDHWMVRPDLIPRARRLGARLRTPPD